MDSVSVAVIFKIAVVCVIMSFQRLLPRLLWLLISPRVLQVTDLRDQVLLAARSPEHRLQGDPEHSDGTQGTALGLPGRWPCLLQGTVAPLLPVGTSSQGPGPHGAWQVEEARSM